MIGEIICVGTELLLGQITNTNARFLAARLSELGIDAYYQQVVGDNRARLRQALELALSRSDLVIAGGGLGPTEDDITKEVVSEVLGVPLVPDPAVAEHILAVLRGHGSQVVEAAVAKQSLVPEGALVFRNPVGTAPGLLVSKGGKHVAMLPGPPQELEPIVTQHLAPALEKILAAQGSRSYLFSRLVKFCHLGEPAVEEAVRDLIRSGNPTVAPYVGIGETHLRVTAKAGSPEQARRLVEEMVEVIRSRPALRPYVFGVDDETIAAACGKALLARRLTCVLAESLTGGLVGHLLTEVPGSSRYFDRGLVVYSNQAKTDLAAVDPAIIEAHGAVSEETALAMARGALAASGAGIAVSLTGIGGPDGGSEGKPTGLVYIALSGAGGDDECRRYVFTGNRWLVKQRSAHRALVLLWLRLTQSGR